MSIAWLLARLAIFTFELQWLNLLIISTLSFTLASARHALSGDIITLGELVVWSMIYQTLTIHVGELVVMAIDNDLLCNKALESVVMTLHNQIFNLSVLIILAWSLHNTWEQVIVVPIHQWHRSFWVFCEYDLIVMPVYQNARDIVLFLHLERGVMFVDHHAFRRLRLLLNILPLLSIIWMPCLSRSLISLLCLSHSTLTFTLIALVASSLLHHLHWLIADLLSHAKTLVCKLLYVH